MGCVYAYVILLTILGPEWKGRPLDVGHDEDFKEATMGRDVGPGGMTRHVEDAERGHSGSDEEKGAKE